MNPNREELLQAYHDLRLCDVRDAMDAMGYFHYGSLDPSIRPLWRTRAFGIARTVRYLPFQGPDIVMDPLKYRREYTGMYYREIGTYPWTNNIQEGDFIVLDQSGLNVGVMGSENSYGCFNRGARGFVTNGGVRDTDEVILEEVPFWSATIAQTMVQIRIQFDAMDIPVAVGGVQICPGDVIVADGDGVIAVPGKVALDVAKWAHEEHDNDKRARRKHYEAAGRAFDDTV